jgi:biopolymer transport protein ExbD
MKKSKFTVLTETREIELSPLIDMVFILLIFFIVTTVFVDESGFATAQSRPAQRTDEEKPPLTFTIRPNSIIEFEGRSISLQGISTEVQNQPNRRELPVIIQVSSGAKSGIAIQAMDQARAGGATIVNFSKVN